MMQRRQGVAVLALMAVTACGETEPSNTVRVSGYVEATEVHVSAETGGRILELRVGEGDRVARGDVVARLDTRDTELQLARARADRGAADAQLRLLQAGSRPEDIAQAQAQVAAARADAAAIEAERTAAQTDLERFEALLRANAGTQRQRDEAKARVDVARERHRAAAERERGAEEVVRRLQAGSRREEIDAARARVAAVDAHIALLDQQLGYATVVAPADGVVTQTLADGGEIVSPRMPLLVLADLDRVWANVFVPEPVVPRLMLGQAADVFTDAGGAGVPGSVSYISPRAEFTPRNVQTAEERSKLVYRVKISVDNRAGVLKQGMPVDAVLTLR